ncbi:hypothetical protein SKAU_G00388140 [Synaphobranchus kaupii]|uniref:BHLH domain-containing protein n=1 Tax=Synaphobranchus kaupii TaxID=118154 RepID=A0A9Q1EAZ3_SYNKA|nr:hypothetical protein SKAU_G00388140 [Synaphobranchus kaupii]
MDSVLSQFLLQEIQAPGCESTPEQSCPGSDPGYYSACGSLSPASSVDSLCLSPPAPRWGASQEPAGGLLFRAAAVDARPRPRPALPAQGTRRSRSCYPGHKRQSASEREKLRMRDLTKALHHLNTYLPPSLAPAGQTLTKIQTLRLAIRYIAHLSAQLEPAMAEEAQSQACSDLSPSCFGTQDSFCQSMGTMTTEQTAMFQPAFPHTMDQYSCPRQTYQNPRGDYSIAQTNTDGYYTLQNQLPLTELGSL